MTDYTKEVIKEELIKLGIGVLIILIPIVMLASVVFCAYSFMTGKLLGLSIPIAIVAFLLLAYKVGDGF